jgi:hypothetical protein
MTAWNVVTQQFQEDHQVTQTKQVVVVGDADDAALLSKKEYGDGD